jgi:hypothetical protein
MSAEPKSNGPLYTAIASAAVAGALLVALLLFPKTVPINMTTVLAVIVPAVTLSATLVAGAIAWIFILIGRLHRQPAWVIATVIMMGITMIELMAIIALAAEAGGGS